MRITQTAVLLREREGHRSRGYCIAFSDIQSRMPFVFDNAKASRLVSGWRQLPTMGKQFFKLAGWLGR
jgi:hypothetical protein